jgi:hypothetical protein
MRFIFWLTVYILCLGIMDIDVLYADGLRVKFVSWWTMLKNRNKGSS